ncbi:MAG: TauD/TfdA family dioxygenase [Pseudomonadaceae bacterium]|nr:TauD/TfdA family dioxygenase [Pseudomonadaceae bacterium]
MSLNVPSSWQVSALSEHMGARISGVESAELLTMDTSTLEDLLARYQIVAFDDQTFDPQTLTQFASLLGSPAAYPFTEPLPDAPFVCEVRKEPDDDHNFGGAWHTDSSYLPRPPAYTLLQALDVPASGGDTLFANTYRAAESLSPKLREILSQLRVNNTSSLVHSNEGEFSDVGQHSNTKQFDAITTASHPVLRRHPITDQLALFVSTIHSASFEGMTRSESQPMIDYLQSVITAESNQARLAWRPGTLAIWDNRCLQHYALNDYGGHRRVMHRVIVQGEVPQ